MRGWKCLISSVSSWFSITVIDLHALAAISGTARITHAGAYPLRLHSSIGTTLHQIPPARSFGNKLIKSLFSTALYTHLL